MLHIENKTNKTLPRIPFKKIAGFALTQGYELSLVFVTNEISREVNKKYRGKDYPTNILSFPLNATEGEILIDLDVVKKEAKEQNENLTAYLTYIFIHGLVHLKGFDHGSKMETEERKIRENFNHLFASSNLL